MKNREEIYPDWKFPVSVKGQNRYNIRTPIHQHGEQTLSKQARTDGKIKSFSANTNAVSNRSYQAKNLACLHKMCNLPTKLNFYKQIRPSHILGSRDMVFKVINTFKNHYINPFNPLLGKKDTLQPQSWCCNACWGYWLSSLITWKGKRSLQGFSPKSNPYHNEKVS